MLKGQYSYLVSELMDISDKQINDIFVEKHTASLRIMEEKKYSSESDLARLKSELVSLEERFADVNSQIRELTEFIDTSEGEKLSLVVYEPIYSVIQ